MQTVCLELSKYVLAFLMAFYALAAYRGAVIRNEDKRKKIYRIQNIIMVIVHFTGYLIMYVVYDDMNYIYLYFAQLVYLGAVIMLYMVFYPKASRLLVNNMCMLMAVGFVMIARLSYTKCVKQFAIAVAGTLLTLAIPWLLKTVKSFRKMGWIYCGTGLVLLLAVLLGNKIYGANLVLTVGPVSVQPAEFVKILYVMFVASMFNKATTFRQTAVVTAFAALHVIILVLSTDLGAALIFFVVYIAMLYIATKNVLYAGAGIMGIVEIPKIDIKLPIYHTTREDVLQVAAGHLEGSSLPVGGASTHAVISAHRGLPSASLFTDLDKLEEGDHFLIHVLNETLCYEVDKISVVKPEETSGLAVEEGKDLVTLLTCTPYGVNTERLLVRGHRVEYVEQEVEAEKTLFSGISIHTNYLLWVIVGLLVTAVFIVVLYKKEQKLKKRRAEQAADGQEAPVLQDRTVTGDADTETEKKE